MTALTAARCGIGRGHGWTRGGGSPRGTRPVVAGESTSLPFCLSDLQARIRRSA
jgi:hypothetical protein